MKTVRGVLLLLLVGAVLFSGGCVSGGADVTLENLELGTVMMDGKPVEGLPSQKINILIQVGARKVIVKYNAEGTILELTPSETSVEIKADGISIKGAKPEQVKVEWAGQKTGE